MSPLCCIIKFKVCTAHRCYLRIELFTVLYMSVNVNVFLHYYNCHIMILFQIINTSTPNVSMLLNKCTNKKTNSMSHKQMFDSFFSLRILIRCRTFKAARNTKVYLNGRTLPHIVQFSCGLLKL